MFRNTLDRVDANIINFLRKISFPMARFALFLVFFWFGFLKIIDTSPAGPMVVSLLDRTMPFIAPDTFMVFFGIFEVIIGITFIIPKLERLAIALLVPHLISTVLPLFLLQSMTWTSMFVPTLEGQYIIKNILIIAVAISLAAHLHPLKTRLN
ncbi:MAG: hypothetical protein AB200_01825 [Parcubacteria bacterium C7867-005]|nr:MAG: hypothetical protein AB200_01825 [Parcubacteria bacterium C7867-005]